MGNKGEQGKGSPAVAAAAAAFAEHWPDHGAGGKRTSGPAASISALLLDLIFPRRCPVCDRPVRPFGEEICRECAGTFERVGTQTCRRCGKRLRTPQEEYCRDCREQEHRFAYGGAALTYRTCAGALYRFKYGGRQEYASYFAGEMARVLRERFAQDPADLLVPVPLHRERMRRRGYNQAALLAAALSERTGIAAEEKALVRVRRTAPMKAMSAAARQNNLKKAFHASANVVKSKSIIVIDDIYTTGATIDACAEALYAAGAAKVCFLALSIGEESVC
ncbi:MAG: double zinc ribbon domain-containing protein [Eubacteriales bacterium]|nr:double zinc ribbon domain-containing protein [Eubacteriales bacterium]